MIRRFAYAAVVLVALAPRPALAEPIKFPDPFVGVRGEEGSTFDIFQNVKKGLVKSITFAFTELGGFGLENEFLSLDPSRKNEFRGNFVLEEDGFSVTLLFGSPISLRSSSYAHRRYSQRRYSHRRSGLPCSNYDEDEPNCTIQVYLYPGLGDEFRGPYATSLRAINGVPIDTTPIPAPVPEPVPAPVPEPGTLLLMGTGIAGLAARRMRRRSS
jgi:hypothetical protein